MLRIKIKAWFQEAVRLDLESPQELKAVLLRGHPRLEGFIDNMCAQIEQAEKVCRVKGVVLREKTIQDFTYDMAKYFMKGMEGEAKRRYESDLERIAREAKAQKLQEFDAVLEGKPEGEFAEAGVISNEKIDKEREAFLESQSKQKS